MLTGRELEQKFNIPQQYRSRWDAQFSNFISPSVETPRRYNDFDIMAYNIIVEARQQKLSRPIILVKLAHLAQNGQVKFYPSEAIPSIEALLSNSASLPTAQERANVRENQPGADNGIRASRPVRPHTGRADQPIIDQLTRLAQENGVLQERIRILEETLGDQELKIFQLSQAINQINTDIVSLKSPLPPAPETPASKTRGFNIKSLLFFLW